MMRRYNFTLSVTLVAPFLQHGLAQASIGHDATPLLDQQGRLIISGDQIEGHVAAIMPNKLRPIWFGKQGSQMDVAPDVPLESVRSRVKIFDLVAKWRFDQGWHQQTRIEVDDSTGASRTGSLQVIAQSHRPGQAVPFAGTGWLLADSNEEAEALIAWIKAALTITPALGAIKSAGWGRIDQAEVKLEQQGRPLAPDHGEGSAMSGCRLLLHLPQPFLVDPDVRSGNVYEGAEAIPGSVLKGAIADMLDLAGQLETYNGLLQVLTIRHAFPGHDRPKMAPLSLAVVKGELVDTLVNQPDGIPKFRPDWKEAEARLSAKGGYRVGDQLPRYVRTRTAIGKGATAETGQLFSQRMVATVDTTQKGLVWTTDLLLPQNGDPAWQKQLGALVAFLKEQGILRIGKTAAPVTVKEGTLPSTGEISGTSMRLTLETPAWLISSQSLLNDKGEAAITGGDVRALYAAYFKQLGVTLVDFMALQSWSGGARAIGERSERPRRYYPWLLTQPGSVFLIDGVTPALASEWQQFGLPLADPDRTWKTCPFARENGFGEVRVERHG